MGQGRSKKEARNTAAKKLIEQLDLTTLPQVSRAREYLHGLQSCLVETTETCWGKTSQAQGH